MKRTVLVFRVSPVMREAIISLARRRGQTASAVIRTAVTREIEAIRVLKPKAAK